MTSVKSLVFWLIIACSAFGTSAHAESECGILDQNVRLLASDDVRNLCHDYPAKLYLIVNTASECAFTPQYEELESLYQDYASRGLMIFGFPSNDFLNQEPADEDEIQSFCTTNFNVTFPMFEKTIVTGPNPSPLYADLAVEFGEPRWNFYKYLVNADGVVIKRFTSIARPENSRFRATIDEILRLIEEDEKMKQDAANEDSM
ncbi:glutathione peroxidase [uncultured Umboniibacter sp.]|uniref:glutathione peroxidase n=1 Tax=uncultured Umboniibacter sp. TaxID=1798917 RepID=UPI0026249A78|nr:glutathione peroxidase [uncultured Umboniibacter sp.]